MDDAISVDPAGTTWAWVDDETATETITRAVADAEGISPMHVDPPLDDVVDTDLLERLFDPACERLEEPLGRVIFPYRDHEVTVHADGLVAIDP